ncbi:MAG: hypothetical protein J7513_00295, partial [Solirubrobacteraceae bacterium]|nr:hypothetical protein [Solirubrobacteraceae bacterium]
DLGTVVTLAQIKIEGNDLRMRIVAGDIPTRVQGIPLNISQLAITMNRDGLVLNPSTCGTFNADVAFGSAQGGTASGSAGYGVDGCSNLAWQPNFQIGFSGPAAELAVKGHPTISTVITQTEGQGSLRSAKVTLPAGIVADTTNISKRVCASAETASAGGCPATSTIGTAEIVTSALRQPVKGDLIIVKIPGQSLPGILVRVRDQISMDLLGASKVDSATGRLKVDFDGVPDTPISKMTLVFNGGSTGVIQVGETFCGVNGVKTDATLGAAHGATKSFALPVTCNGSTNNSGGSGGSTVSRALSSVSFKPDGANSAMTFALSNPNGIKKVVIKMPKGAIFKKNASKLVKLTLTGAKAKVRIVNGDRRIAISISPTVAGTKVTKVKFKLPSKAIKINIKFRKVLENKKTSKKKKAKLLAKLMAPSVTTLDGDGKSVTVKTKIAVSTKK